MNGNFILNKWFSPTRINVSDFSQYPGGRRLRDTPVSGERFRTEILIPALRRRRQVLISFDGVHGVASSWLNEVFAHPDTRAYHHYIRFVSVTPYMSVYHTICDHFLSGKRPYNG